MICYTVEAMLCAFVIYKYKLQHYSDIWHVEMSNRIMHVTPFDIFMLICSFDDVSMDQFGESYIHPTCPY